MKPPPYYALIILVGVLILLLGMPGPGRAQGPPGSTDKPLVDQLKRESAGPVRVSYHAETGRVRFIGTTPNSPIRQPSVLGVDVSPEEAGRGFLAVYGKLFGLKNPGRELAVMKMRTLGDGRSFVRFQQRHRGVPIVGGELVVQSDAKHNIISANGEILPDVDVEVTPTISAEAAGQTALAMVAKEYGMSTTDLTTSEPELWIYNPILLGSPGPHFSTLVWRLEVTPVELLPIRELVLVDARLGVIALNFNQVDTAKNRLTYDANNGTTLPGSLVCDETNPTCSGGDSHEVAAHTYAGDTYDYYMAEHGRDSIDNAGMTLVSTVHYGSGYLNAFWNGTQMVYGDAAGFPLADDVVGHELTHGVTEHESGLFYYYQSGAINESLSDVWGEFIDQVQATGNDVGDTRWELGEDIAGYGAIRNMQDPPAFSDPDKMTSNLYACGQSQLGSPVGDNGGVHTNSGVNNKAAYLMVDGDTFNGKTVTGLGISKVADLYYEAQTNLLVSGSDYADLYDALIQASINLSFSPAEQQEVIDALDAVEMNQQPTNCPAPEAPICDTGIPVYLFFDNIESGGSNWISGSNQGNPYWFVPQTSETLGLSGPYATSGVGNIWGFDQGSRSDTYLAMNSDVTLPANAYLHFNHSFGFESDTAGTARYDGGILEYSTNSGGSWNNAGSLFTDNGYNGTLAGSGNPLGAISAFSADSRGYISSRLDLSSLAGNAVRFRFRIGTDPSVYDYGWFIDDVGIYTCSSGNTPVISGLPDKSVPMNGSANNATDLWFYASDAQDSDSALTFTISNSPVVSAGVTIDSHRYIDINPAGGWVGSTNVTVQVEDTSGFTGTDTFQVSVTGLTYLPLLLKGGSGGGSGGIINGDFEDGPTGWTESSSNGFALILSSSGLPVAPHGGNWAVWLGGFPNELSYIEQQVTVSPGSPYLAYWHWRASTDSCGSDIGGVAVNGSNVESYFLCTSTNTGGWVKRVVNLSAYAGQSVTLRIWGMTNDSLNSNLFIDDVSFQSSLTIIAETSPKTPSSFVLDDAILTKSDIISSQDGSGGETNTK